MGTSFTISSNQFIQILTFFPTKNLRTFARLKHILFVSIIFEFGDQNMTDNNQQDFTDERRGPRKRTYQGARIIVDKNSTFNCVIKTRSDKGFGLKLGTTTGIPDQFTLFDDSTGQSHKCMVIWRKRAGLGVKITD